MIVHGAQGDSEETSYLYRCLWMGLTGFPEPPDLHPETALSLAAQALTVREARHHRPGFTGAIFKVPRKSRAAWLLDEAGLPVKEIAQVLDSSPASVLKDIGDVYEFLESVEPGLAREGLWRLGAMAPTARKPPRLPWKASGLIAAAALAASLWGTNFWAPRLLDVHISLPIPLQGTVMALASGSRHTALMTLGPGVAQAWEPARTANASVWPHKPISKPSHLGTVLGIPWAFSWSGTIVGGSGPVSTLDSLPEGNLVGTRDSVWFTQQGAFTSIMVLGKGGQGIETLPPNSVGLDLFPAARKGVIAIWWHHGQLVAMHITRQGSNLQTRSYHIPCPAPPDAAGVAPESGGVLYALRGTLYFWKISWRAHASLPSGIPLTRIQESASSLWQTPEGIWVVGSGTVLLYSDTGTLLAATNTEVPQSVEMDGHGNLWLLGPLYLEKLSVVHGL